MCQRIFISYKRVDKKIVFPIKDYIEKNVGETCWIDLDGIESDAQFVNVIMNAIDNARVFLFMYSQAHSIIKDYSTDWTVRELNYAQKKGKRIVFINIDKYPLSDYFLFMFPQKQQVDATSKEAMQKLCHDLKAWLNIEKPTHTPPPLPPQKPEWLRRIKSFISNTKRNIWHGIKEIVKWISSKAKTIAIVICCAAAIALGWMFIPQIISIFNNEEAKASSLSAPQEQSGDIINKKRQQGDNDVDTNIKKTQNKDNGFVEENKKIKYISDQPSPNEGVKKQAERFQLSLKNKNWDSMRKLADENYTPAYLPLAKHYIEYPEKHGLAKKYALKAKKAGIKEAEEILNYLDLLDF